MAGNQLRMIINTLERAVSSDINVLEQYQAYERNEVLKALYDDTRWPIQFPGYNVQNNSLTTPLKADVLSGLLVRCDSNTDLLIDPGVLLAIVPALAGTADSKAVVVIDPGVQATGVLTFTSNGGVAPRLDIIECSVVDTLITTSSRDIYNSTTGLFTPAVVEKVRRPTLSYRIRLGTAGAGLPALASGWLPLAVACHQPGTTGFNQVDFWDVRPLVADRVQFGNPALTPAGAASSFEYPLTGRWNCINSGTNGNLVGWASRQFNGYLAGGPLLFNGANVIANFGNQPSSVGLNDTETKTPGFALTASTMVHLAACFPGGLPRWVKYIDAAVNGPGGIRVPYGPRGILVSTNAQPSVMGEYTSVTLPALCGFTSGAPGVALAAVGVSTGGVNAAGACAGNVVHIPANSAILVPGVAGVGTPTVTFTFEPAAAAKVPNEAKEILVLLLINAAASGQGIVFAAPSTGSTDPHFYEYFTYTSGASRYVPLRIPLARQTPNTSYTTIVTVQSVAAGMGNITTCDLVLVGYVT